MPQQPTSTKLPESLEAIVNVEVHTIDDHSFRDDCKASLDTTGVLILPEFLSADAITQVAEEGQRLSGLAYYTANDHNVYLKPKDSDLPDTHPRNRRVSSTKGCITTDQIPLDSPLQVLYNSSRFRDFLCTVLGEAELYEYADPLSSINLHYASEGRELGWHFDNSSFAITLLIQKPEAGGVFEFVKDVRNADSEELSYERVGEILDGKVAVQKLALDPGALVLFRGRNSIHRVTPTIGDTTRMLVVLAYNTEPDKSLSESARMTFYGRLG